ncbi:STM4014 family protein [Singulisphaera sp. Ch08]|uniref:STM4014 family protein n=1 Tax=Singulisphaera sp. Ch08 TaxID=3120278 RepID=A0AAU7CCP6_9BACT
MRRPPFHAVIVGNPECPRIERFQAAMVHAGLSPATIVAYRDLIAGRVGLEQFIREGTVLRIESPGRDFAVERAILAFGAGVEDDDGPTRLLRVEAEQLVPDKGRIWCPRQWYLGFRETLRLIDRQRAACPSHVTTSPTAAIEVMFDKVRCHDRLTRAAVSCPRGLGPVRSYEELRHRMVEAGIGRVFVKLAHGSSASGVVAFAADGRRQLAITTVEMVHEGGEPRLYNSRAIRRVENHREVAALIDALARERVQVERWVPKAGIAGHVFDLRVLVIAGRAEHVVVRMSRGPMTNLHLKNRRGDPAAVKARMLPEAWAAALGTCEAAAAQFPGCLHAGVDLLITPHFRHHAVLEVNAFGDLLHGATHRGVDPYSAEVAAMLAREAA